MNKNITLNKAQYIAGDTIEITISNLHATEDVFTVNIYHLAHQLEVENHFIYTKKSDNTYALHVTLGPMDIGNYGVEIIIGQDTYETAFDVVSNHSDCIRYGFLSDFSDKDDDLLDIEYLKNLHLNAIQFYDWMYKHDDLISKEKNYLDPLGRPTNLDTVQLKIDKCIQVGMRPFAYGAIYAASKSLFSQHPEWGLFHSAKAPLVFFDWLNFMNISKENAWSGYILDQFQKSMKQLHFMGIHMDTYGFPKIVYDINHHRFSLGDQFSNLIQLANNQAKEIDENNGVIFNCVNNWPVQKIASASQDAIYIEVWPPHDTYFDLYRLIREARCLSRKNVILAAYIHPFKDAKSDEEIQMAERSLLLANAVINASGGTQLVFGEQHGILCDSYYAKYATARPSFIEKIQNYSDYLVRYADLLYKDHGMDISMTSTSGINEDIVFSSNQTTFSPNGKESTVWTMVREQEKMITIQLLNLTNNDARWNTPKLETNVIDDMEMTIKMDYIIQGIYCASPDHLAKAIQLDFQLKLTDRGRVYQVKLPKLHLWNTVWIETE